MSHVANVALTRAPSRDKGHLQQLGSLFDAIAPYLLIGALLIAWELATDWRLVMPFLLPPPAAVVRWIVDDVSSGKFFISAGWTLYRTLVGFALAAVFGVAIEIGRAHV